MSIDATIATWKLGKEVTAIQKLILLSLADRAGESGECWPSIKRIEVDTNLNRKTIVENRQELLAMGLIKYTGFFYGKQKQIPGMRLTYVHPREGKIDLETADNFTNTENGHGKKFTSTENGTGTSTENGTLNLKEEPTNIKHIKDLAGSTNTAIKNYEDDLRFMAFYDLYPRKAKPKDAWKAFKALKPDDSLLFHILENVKVRIEKDAQWQHKQFIPYPATFLRSEQYKADILYIADAKTKKPARMTLNHVMGDTSWAI